MRTPADASSTDAYIDYVNGANTATNETASVEYSKNSAPITPFPPVSATLDSDHDGLTDVQERKLGTNPYLSDTDGDGYTDKQEVDSGHDPLKK